MNTRRTEHDIALEQLICKPGLIGVRDLVVWSARELNVFKEGDTDLLTQIDLFYKTENGIYIAEFKGGEDRRRAVKQLDLAADFVAREFGEQPTKVYVHGAGYKYELIR